MYLTRDGCRLWIDRRGCGTRSLVFLHDLMMSSCAWASQLYAFQESYGMCTVDFRGFGRSDKSGNACAIGTLVEDLRFVLGELGIHRPVLIGAGMGATVAMTYAASDPGAVSGLVVVAAAPCLERRPGFRWALPAEEVAALVEGLRTDFHRAAGEYIGLAFPRGTGLRQVEGIMRVIAREADPVVAASCLSDLAALDLRSILPRIDVPVSVINSFSDRLAPVWAGAWLANALGAEKFLVVPVVGHAPYLTAAKHFNDALSSILPGLIGRGLPDAAHGIADGRHGLAWGVEGVE